MDKRAAWEQAADVLPRGLTEGLGALGERRLREAEEFRLRRGVPLSVVLPEGEAEVRGPAVTEEHLRQTLENATRASAHTVLDRVQRGFVTLRGGHRIGLCGTVACKDGEIVTLRELSSLNIRVARQIRGQAVSLLPALTEGGRFLSTLILAPPGAGKTTLLRDLIRALSDGEGIAPHRVGVADERGEIAALWRGEAQMDVGRRTDVMDGCPKAQGMSILLRGMNPQVLAADEITDPADARSIIQAAGCGVELIATAHGASIRALQERPVYRALLKAGVFRRLVIIEQIGRTRKTQVEALP